MDKICGSKSSTLEGLHCIHLTLLRLRVVRYKFVLYPTNTVSPCLIVKLILQFTVSEDSINSTEGYFTTERRSSCHNFSVEFNNIVEENGVVTLTINDTSLWPYNTAVSVPVATSVHIVNDDGELYLMFAIIHIIL